MRNHDLVNEEMFPKIYQMSFQPPLLKTRYFLHIRSATSYFTGEPFEYLPAQGISDRHYWNANFGAQTGGFYSNEVEFCLSLYDHHPVFIL
jgi:hypothetical protein